MKKSIIIIAFIIIALIGASSYFYYKNYAQINNSNYEAERTSTEDSANKSEQNQEKKQSTQEQANNNAQPAKQPGGPEQPNQPAPTPTEAEEISSFSTKIYTKDSNRQNNITITCSALNDTDIANGSTFSFCNTVGRSSPSKGYKKADIFTDGQKTKGYGGGNCQVSTTLYNAVLKVPTLKITERHEHSNKVPYIQNGKDAAVSYGAYDFKFVNNTGNTVRIKASHTTNSVTIRLVKVL